MSELHLKLEIAFIFEVKLFKDDQRFIRNWR